MILGIAWWVQRDFSTTVEMVRRRTAMIGGGLFEFSLEIATLTLAMVRRRTAMMGGYNLVGISEISPLRSK